MRRLRLAQLPSPSPPRVHRYSPVWPAAATRCSAVAALADPSDECHDSLATPGRASHDALPGGVSRDGYRGGSESRSSRAVGFVGCNQLVEFADCGFFQHLAAPLAQIRDVEPALLDVQDAPDVERIILAVQRHFQEDQIFGGRHADGMAKAIL